MSDQDDIGPADEQALREMFAALVADAGSSPLSPLEVQRLGAAEQRAGIESRARRVKYTRNTLIAAVLVGVVALILPRIVSSTGSETSAASASSVPAAAPAAGSGYAANSGAPAAPRSAAAADRSSASASGAFSSAAAGTSASSAAATSDAMSSGPASSAASSPVAPAATSAASSAASSGAASSAPTCLPVPARAVGVVRAALPGYRGAVLINSCTSLRSAGAAVGTATFVIAGSTPSSSCASTSDCPAVSSLGAPLPGTKDAYTYRGGVVVVGSNGVSVTATATAGGPDRAALVAAARALLATLG